MADVRISKALADEVFVMRGHGIYIRVADLIDAVNASPDVAPSWHATAQLLALYRSDRIDEACIEQMYPLAIARRDAADGVSDSLLDEES